MSSTWRLLIECGIMTYHVRLTFRFSSARLDVNFCDDGVSFPPLESELEKVIDPPLTTLLFVAPSSFSASVDEDDSL